MKVIDLLNMISKGEEVPTPIRFRNDCYDFDDGDYFNQQHRCWIFNDNDISGILNDEVEVIEEKEETKPITKESIEALGYACGEIQKCFINGWNKSLKNEPLIEEDKKIKKVSECFTSTDNKEIQFLIDNINQLGNKINEIIDKINKMEDK